MAVSYPEVGCRRAKPLPSYAGSEDAISRLETLSISPSSLSLLPPQTISAASKVQPLTEHSNDGFSKSWDGAVGSHSLSIQDELLTGPVELPVYVEFGLPVNVGIGCLKVLVVAGLAVVAVNGVDAV